MKKTSDGKLRLRGEVVRELTAEQLAVVQGGDCKTGSGDTKIATTGPAIYVGRALDPRGYLMLRGTC